ncbi:MAG TPA: hypothetical protein ENN88_00450, partial [Candidatus Coatesbacteria bacterium]|nr:hypothetical protein [Candidatus Coatesbacteria bacterium]
MRRTIYPLLTACLFLALAGCASEGGDPTEAVPADVFLVVHAPEVGLLWDGAESLLGELRQVEPRLADELVKMLEEPAGELFGDGAPQSLQDLWNLGVDVDKAFCIAVGGLPVPQTAVIVSIHDASAFCDFYYGAIGEEKPAPVESYSEADIRLSRGVYSAFDEGLFLASDSLPLLKSCLDALDEPEKRFFAAESVRPLAARSAGDTISLLVDFGAVRGPLALAMT